VQSVQVGSLQISNIENTTKAAKDLSLVKNIQGNISEFLDIISDMNNPSEDEFFEAIMQNIINKYETTKNI